MLPWGFIKWLLETTDHGIQEILLSSDFEIQALIQIQENNRFKTLSLVELMFPRIQSPSQQKKEPKFDFSIEQVLTATRM